MPSVTRRKQVVEYLQGRSDSINRIARDELKCERALDPEVVIPKADMAIIKKWISSSYPSFKLPERKRLDRPDLSDSGKAIKLAMLAETEDDVKAAITLMDGLEERVRSWRQEAGG